MLQKKTDIANLGILSPEYCFKNTYLDTDTCHWNVNVRMFVFVQHSQLKATWWIKPIHCHFLCVDDFLSVCVFCCVLIVLINLIYSVLLSHCFRTSTLKWKKSRYIRISIFNLNARLIIAVQLIRFTKNLFFLCILNYKRFFFKGKEIVWNAFQ